MTKVIEALSKTPLENLEDKLVSPDPDIIPADAQISSPANPSFHRRDVPNCGLSRSMEIQQIEFLQHKIEITQNYVPFLYSYRSISRAINRGDYLKSASTDPELQVQIMTLYKKLFEPLLEQIIELHTCMIDAADSLSKIVQKFDQFLPSCVFYEKLIEFFDIIFNLDQMKQIKTGLTNDLSYYRRDTKNIDPTKFEMTGKAALFLGTRFFALNEIKKQKIIMEPKPEIINFFVDFLNFCVSYYNRSILPKKKFSIIISMVIVLYVFNIPKLAEKGNLNNVYQILSENPIVPMYGEMNFKPFEILQENKTFVAPKGINMAVDNKDIRAFSNKYLIKDSISHFRSLFNENLSNITRICKTGKIDHIEDIYKIIQCVADMTAAITRQSAYKFALPATTKDQSFYDNQVKNNYEPSELDYLIEMIGDLKTLTGFALKSEATVLEHAYPIIAKTIQDFLYNLEGCIQEAKKKKETEVSSVLEAIQDIFQQGKIEKKGEKKKQSTANLVAPSNHMLDILRCQISGLSKPGSVLYDKKGKPRGYVKKANLIEQFSHFADSSEKFYILLNYSEVIRDSTNIGSLWFRETCLDIENKMQFPVRSSLPFILSEHILNSSIKPGLHDSIFFPLEIYNDAASSALNNFKSSFLYREIEAEVTLCVDMISFNFAHTFFKFSRATAAASILPPELISKINTIPIRFNFVVKQSKLQLLGSPINFNLITSQKINEILEKEMSDLVFKITDFRLVPYVHEMIQILKKTHQLLVRSGLYIDDFDTIWKLARGASHPLSPVSTLAATVINVFDVSHMIYNCLTRRFLTSKKINLVPPINEKWAEYITKLHSQDIHFIGSEHINAIVELLDEGELRSFISCTIMGIIESDLQKAIEVYMEIASCLRLLPVKSKDDLDGFYSFISDAYSEMSHPMLGTLYNLLRNVGNMIAFAYLLETELKPIGGNLSLMSSVVQLIREIISLNKNLFVTQEFEHDNVITHRTFSALWCVLEFLLCTPSPVKLSENIVKSKLLEEFGDGIVICAHTLISLSGELGVYKYDSMVTHTLNLYNVTQVVASKGPIQTFVYNASTVNTAKNFAEIMIYPFMSLPPI